MPDARHVDRSVGRAPLRARLLIALACLCFSAVGAGCARPRDFSQPSAADPQARLDFLLDAWQRAHADGRRCEEVRPGDTPIVDCDRLRKQIERLAIEFPTHREILLANALVAFESGRPDEAEKELDVLRRLDPANPEAAMLRARIAIGDGNLRLAGRLLDEQLQRTPDEAGLYELSASVLYLEERWDDAAHAIEVASRLGAPAWRVAYHRGLVFEATGRMRDAAEAYRACLELAPDHDPARARLKALAVHESLRR